MIKTFVFKAYQSKKNKKLHHLIDVAASLYNHCIRAQIEHYKLFGKRLNKYALQKSLTLLKRSGDYSFLKILNSQVVQDVTDRIDRGYSLFYTSKKNKTKRTVRPPSYKKASKYKSITFKQSGDAFLEGNRIRIGKDIYK